MIGASSPIPKIKPKIVNRPRVGIDRAEPTTAPTKPAPRLVWPTTIPIGRAIAAAIPTTPRVRIMCSRSLAPMPDGPRQLAESVSHLRAERK